MDLIITYVNGNDPIWKKEYERCVGGPVLEKRFRDWDTLQYLFRGIEKHMPFIGNVFLVVSSESQVPQWVNRETVKVVLHSDFVPSEFLPTFNCNTLEMYLHRIPGLSEEFLYFNDDLFPLRDMRPEEFFRDGKVVVKHSKHLFAGNFFKKIVRQSDRLARTLCGKKASAVFVRPQHTASAMLRSNNTALEERAAQAIRSNISTIRENTNYNQYLFSDYLYYCGQTVREKISNKHFSLAAASASGIERFLENPSKSIACINDVQMPLETFLELRERIKAAFEKRFADKSKYEL